MRFRIIGTPRSGTNYTKFLIESGSKHECGFNIEWWKHAVIPALMDGPYSKVQSTPTLILFRNPIEQIASWYKFIKMGGVAISGNEENISMFMKSPISLNHQSIRYKFSSPMEYWLCYYNAALTWEAPKAFLELESIKNNVELVAKAASALANQEIVFRDIPDDVNSYMGRNKDQHVSNGWNLEKKTTLDSEKNKISEIINSMTDEDKDNLLSDETIDLYKKLIKKSDFIL
jgi:hypothetical protein